MEGINLPVEKETHQILFDDIEEEKNLSVPKISFSGIWNSYCIGIVDLVDSTKIVTMLKSDKMCEYYRVFLNWMAIVAQEFDAVTVKNVGDSIIYYFPKTRDGEDKDAIKKALNCGLAMLESHSPINKFMRKQGLPPVNYRVSFDYGRLAIAKSSTSSVEDLFGPTVNVCAKMNSIALPNQMVLGGDLYQLAKSFKEYSFNEMTPCCLGLKFDYSVYSVYRAKGFTSNF